MYIDMKETEKIFATYSINNNKQNSGSTESQISLLTFRIKHLTKHLIKNPKDFNTKLSMQKLVNKRKSNLKYLSKKFYSRYKDIITKLNLRK